MPPWSTFRVFVFPSFLVSSDPLLPFPSVSFARSRALPLPFPSVSLSLSFPGPSPCFSFPIFLNSEIRNVECGTSTDDPPLTARDHAERVRRRRVGEPSPLSFPIPISPFPSPLSPSPSSLSPPPVLPPTHTQANAPVFLPRRSTRSSRTRARTRSSRPTRRASRCCRRSWHMRSGRARARWGVIGLRSGLRLMGVVGAGAK